MRYLCLMVTAVLAVVMTVRGAPSQERRLAPRWHELSSDYTYELFASHFGKNPLDGERRAVFEANLAAILAHNSRSEERWRMGVNQFTDLTREEFRRSYLGRRGAKAATPPPPPSPPPRAGERAEPRRPRPAAVDWRERGIINSVRDQGRCGSCWAHASVEQIESYAALASGKLLTLSTQQLVSCAPNPRLCGGTGGCGGSISELAFEYVHQSGGIATEWTYPYVSYDGQNPACHFNNSHDATPARVAVGGFHDLTSNSYDDVMDALAHVGPLTVNVQADGWQHYESGTFDGCRDAKNIDIDHVVQAVGYGVDEQDGSPFFLVRNSWDVTFGMEGYIRLAAHPQPACGIDKNPNAGTGCNSTQPVTVCGECGILYSTNYPTGVRLLT